MIRDCADKVNAKLFLGCTGGFASLLWPEAGPPIGFRRRHGRMVRVRRARVRARLQGGAQPLFSDCSNVQLCWRRSKSQPCLLRQSSSLLCRTWRKAICIRPLALRSGAESLHFVPEKIVSWVSPLCRWSKGKVHGWSWLARSGIEFQKYASLCVASFEVLGHCFAMSVDLPVSILVASSGIIMQVQFPSTTTCEADNGQCTRLFGLR